MNIRGFGRGFAMSPVEARLSLAAPFEVWRLCTFKLVDVEFAFCATCLEDRNHLARYPGVHPLPAQEGSVEVWPARPCTNKLQRA